MHKYFLSAALLGAGLLAGPLSAHAQADEQLLYLGTGLGLGVGRYNDLGLSTGLNLRFQQPLGAGASWAHTAGAARARDSSSNRRFIRIMGW